MFRHNCKHCYKNTDIYMKSRLREDNNLLKVTQQMSGRITIWTQVVWLQGLCSKFYSRLLLKCHSQLFPLLPLWLLAWNRPPISVVSIPKYLSNQVIFLPASCCVYSLLSKLLKFSSFKASFSTLSPSVGHIL